MHALLAFNGRCFGVSCSQVRTPGLGSSMWGSDSLLLRDDLCHCDFPLTGRSLHQGCGSYYIDSMNSLVAQRLKCLPAMWETWVQSLGQEDSPGEENGNPLQYSCLENPMDGGAWWAIVHGVTKSGTWLSDFTFTLKKEIWDSHFKVINAIVLILTQNRQFRVWRLGFNSKNTFSVTHTSSLFHLKT